MPDSRDEPRWSAALTPCQVNTQAVPPVGPLLAKMPTGREFHTDRLPFKPPVLGGDALDAMRAPPDRDDDFGDAPSSDEEGASERTLAGAYPGEYGRSSSAGYY